MMPRCEVIGDCTLWLGDALDLWPTVGPVDAVICDLPYGTTACAWDTPIPFPALWDGLRPLISAHTPLVFFGIQPFTSAMIMSNPQWYRHNYVWNKQRVTGGANAAYQPMRAHEDIVVFAAASPLYHPQMTEWSAAQIQRMRWHNVLVVPKTAIQHASHIAPGRMQQAGRGRHPTTVIHIPALGSRDTERVGHPTQKPIALLAYLLQTYTEPHAVVLDFCMDSGTTGVACARLGRRFIGVEKEREWFDLACRRIEAAYRQPDLFLEHAKHQAPTQEPLFAREPRSCP